VTTCVFCRIIAGELPSVQVGETEACLAFLDTRPIFPGHVLVVPRAHLETLGDLEPHLVEPFFSFVQRVSMAVERGLSADGTFVAMNNRVSQSVPHLHVHVVPRRKKDGLRGFFWPRHSYATLADAMAIAEPIRSALRA
jgi:histidine triad (HIT) family protein